MSAKALFLGCPFCSFVHSYGQILLPRYLVSGLNTFDNKTDREYSLAPTDDLFRFWRSWSHGSTQMGKDEHWTRFNFFSTQPILIHQMLDSTNPAVYQSYFNPTNPWL